MCQNRPRNPSVGAPANRVNTIQRVENRQATGMLVAPPQIGLFSLVEASILVSVLPRGRLRCCLKATA